MRTKCRRDVSTEPSSRLPRERKVEFIKSSFFLKDAVRVLTMDSEVQCAFSVAKTIGALLIPFAGQYISLTQSPFHKDVGIERVNLQRVELIMDWE